VEIVAKFPDGSVQISQFEDIAVKAEKSGPSALVRIKRAGEGITPGMGGLSWNICNTARSRPGIGSGRWKRCAGSKEIISCIVNCSGMLYIITQLERNCVRRVYEKD